ncbi:hypothetical protein WK77_02075 [Burkholderia ubonensis]|nr:hypothetical protein WK77_02075 [Burkholderia ubonensis]
MADAPPPSSRQSDFGKALGSYIYPTLNQSYRDALQTDGGTRVLIVTTRPKQFGDYVDLLHYRIGM